MSNVRRIFEEMPGRYISGSTDSTKTIYFSVGDEKWTVTLHPDRCEAQPGKLVDNADLILKCEPKLFENMILKGKMPGMMDIARGKIKTNDPAQLQGLMSKFRTP